MNLLQYVSRRLCAAAGGTQTLHAKRNTNCLYIIQILSPEAIDPTSNLGFCPNLSYLYLSYLFVQPYVMLHTWTAPGD